jgi:hypothetical protein
LANPNKFFKKFKNMDSNIKSFRFHGALYTYKQVCAYKRNKPSKLTWTHLNSVISQGEPEAGSSGWIQKKMLLSWEMKLHIAPEDLPAWRQKTVILMILVLCNPKLMNMLFLSFQQKNIE